MIVGGSYSGFTMAEYLWADFKVTIIDQKDHFEYVASNLKCAIDDSWSERILIKYSDVIKGHVQRFSFIQASLVDVNTDDTITIQKVGSESTDVLHYDILLLCTGFSYDPPVKDSNMLSMEDR